MTRYQVFILGMFIGAALAACVAHADGLEVKG